MQFQLQPSSHKIYIFALIYGEQFTLFGKCVFELALPKDWWREAELIFLSFLLKKAECNATVLRLGDANHHIHYTDYTKLPQCWTRLLLATWGARVLAEAQQHKDRWSEKHTQVQTHTHRLYIISISSAAASFQQFLRFRVDVYLKTLWGLRRCASVKKTCCRGKILCWKVVKTCHFCPLADVQINQRNYSLFKN